MNKCLVSQLGAEITGNAPRMFGKATVVVTSNALAAIWITSSKDQKLSLLAPNGTVIKDEIAQANVRLHFQCGDISSYEYVTLVIPYAYAIQFMYGHNQASFGGDSSAVYKIDLREFSFCQATTLTEYDSNKMGFNLMNMTITDFTDDIFLNFTSCIITNALPSSNIDNIGFLGGCLKLNLFNISTNSGSYIGGEFMNVFEKQCFNGRISGTITCNTYGDNPNVTFDGIKLNWTTFTVNFNTNGCEVVGGTNWDGRFKYHRAVFDKKTEEWSFYTE